MVNRVNYGVMFNGRRIVHPGGYDAIDASATTVVSQGGLNVPIVIGTATAGESGVVQWFTSPEAARKVLRGGQLPLALEMMFSPLPEGGGGSSLVGVIVANKTKRASGTIGNVEVTALEYGEGGNHIQFGIEDGGIPDTKKVTVYRWDTEELEVYDNLGALAKIVYDGPESYASLEVTVENDVATKLTTKVGTDEASALVDVSLDLTSTRFKTLDSVVKHLDGLSGYTASYDGNNSSQMPVGKLEAVTDLDIKVGNYLTSVAGDLETQISRYSEIVEVKLTGDATNTDLTYLTGGDVGDTPVSWTPYLDTVKKNFSDLLVILDSSESLHAEALAHVTQMERRNQKQMLFTGGDIGDSISVVKERAAALNSSRAVLAYPGIYHRSVDEGKTVLPAYFTGAMIAGRVSGVDASEPVTFDHFNLVALEKDLLAGDPEVDELLISGVATLERVENGGIRLVQGITTYIKENNTLYREISVRRGADKLSNTMRKIMEDTFVGKRGLRATDSAVNTKAIDVLEEAVREGTITAYRNIVVRMEGTAVYIDYEVAPVEPINFVLISSHFVPDSLFDRQ